MFVGKMFSDSINLRKQIIMFPWQMCKQILISTPHKFYPFLSQYQLPGFIQNCQKYLCVCSHKLAYKQVK